MKQTKERAANAGPFYVRVERHTGAVHVVRKHPFAQIVEGIEWIRTHPHVHTAKNVSVVYSNGNVAVRVI
jgi:hypothetical protein